MRKKSNIQLPLNLKEKQQLKLHKLKKSDLLNYAADELSALLVCDEQRAREIQTLMEFQQLPSIGIRFAEDLIFLGYYTLEELKGKNPTELIHQFEINKGYWLDPCLEDQFRLIVYFADTGDYSKEWWDFTPIRKEYRRIHGYPADRPKLSWYEWLKSNNESE